MKLVGHRGRRPQRRPGMRDALSSASIGAFDDARRAIVGPIRFIRSHGRLPAGRRVYAIGDVHGHRDKLQAAHRIVADDLAARPIASATLVHLGDYIGAGPDSAGVVALLSGGSPVIGIRVVNLMGDYERHLLDALSGDRAAATDLLWSGGREMLASWGIDPATPCASWESLLPQGHADWLRGLDLTYQAGDYLFVHAGIRPGVPLSAQAPEDLLTIRQTFLSTETDFGCVVVHGHTPAPSVKVAENRIGLDTGAGMGGALTGAVFEDDVVGLFSV
jgi:serine/threonine protein phosphatase 1